METWMKKKQVKKYFCWQSIDNIDQMQYFDNIVSDIENLSFKLFHSDSLTRIA